ncbi:RDD family protein [Fulvivirga ulvae]|uniref:RDD family protein n=1 Tax=Fulvivirga ulvae TaxID=2904245 RepID=UPI001F4556FE|nr:RDD family protein [Fulvivirga ulvae]UII34354.1 RDD family protein [Fulvivirga ulvae]
MDTNQVLDQGLTPRDGAAQVKINLASAGQRIGNYVIDTIAYYILLIVFIFILGFLGILDDSPILIYPLAFGIIFGYYIIMEATFGKTLGKFVTGTKVVTENGEKPSAGAIVGRTFCRLIPFEAFSLLGSQAIGWHDSIPGTRVIRDR